MERVLYEVSEVLVTVDLSHRWCLSSTTSPQALVVSNYLMRRLSIRR